MKAQRLKTFNDFVKRAELLSQSLLIVTEDNRVDCLTAILELRAIKCEIPFYELNLSKGPSVKVELENYSEILGVPTFIYFHKNKMIGQMAGYNNASDFLNFLTALMNQFDNN